MQKQKLLNLGPKILYLGISGLELENVIVTLEINTFELWNLTNSRVLFSNMAKVFQNCYTKFKNLRIFIFAPNFGKFKIADFKYGKHFFQF